MERIIELIMTSEQMDKLTDKARSTKVKRNKIVATELRNWYEANKERLDKEKDVLLEIGAFRVDEETEKLYKLFLEDAISKLIK